MLSARHNESLNAVDVAVKSFQARRGVLRNKFSPEFRSEADDKVHSSGGGPWFTDRGDCRSECLALSRVQNVELQVRMRGRSEGKNSSLRRIHAGIISGTISAETDRRAT